MKILNDTDTTKSILVVLLKSDNYECWCSYEVYKLLQLSMSSGDYGSHKAIGLYVDCNQLDDLKGRDTFIESLYSEDNEIQGFNYWSNFDCNIELF